MQENKALSVSFDLDFFSLLMSSLKNQSTMIKKLALKNVVKGYTACHLSPFRSYISLRERERERGPWKQILDAKA